MTKELMEEIKNVLRQLESEKEEIAKMKKERDEIAKQVRNAEESKDPYADKRPIKALIEEGAKKNKEIKEKEELIKQNIETKREKIEKKLLEERKEKENDNSKKAIIQGIENVIDNQSNLADKVQSEIDELLKKANSAGISRVEREGYINEIDKKDEELEKINKNINERKGKLESYKKEKENAVNGISSEIKLFSEDNFNYESLINDDYMQTLNEYINIKDIEDIENERKSSQPKTGQVKGAGAHQPQRQQPQEQQDENKKDKVIFNARTGTYTYIDKNNEPKEIPLEKIDRKYKKQIAEILGLDKKQAKKFDYNLYRILCRVGQNKAKEYLEAFKTGDSSKMPIDLEYDIRNKNSYGDKEKDSRKTKLSLLEKIGLKRVANHHGKNNLAEVKEEKSLFKKILLGLSVATVGTALLTASPEQKINENATTKEQEGENLNEKDLLENLGVTEAQFDGIVNDRLELFKETDLVKVEPGQEYKETSDSTENEKTGQFVDEDGVYKIVRRALINKDENGKETIIKTTQRGEDWEEAGVDIEEYKKNGYIEKYALEAENGEKDSRGYSVFGWVNADNCEKIYEKEQEINGEKIVGRFTMKELREMLLEEIEERGGLTMREKLKVRPSELQKTTQEQTTQERTTEKEMEM